MEHLSGLDASFLYLETPEMHMHVALTAILDPSDRPGGYSFEAIVELIESRIHRVPPFRRRLMRVPFDLHHPVWVDDPHFDIIHHVRRVALPAPGGARELGEMCGRIASTPLDRSRPLWEAWVIEGLADGRFAVMVKVHHCAVDGTSGAGLLVHLFDLSPAPPTPRAPVHREPEPVPTDKELVRHALKARVKQPVELARLVGRTARNLAEVIRQRVDPTHTSAAMPLTAPRTHFNSAISAPRLAAFARVPLAEVKHIKNALGCTVNDVVLALCAGALRQYLIARGDLPEQALVAACPISVHDKGSPGGHNKVSALFTTLATHIDDPLERLAAIQAVTRGAKEEHNAIGADMLQSWAELAAPTTFHMAARFYTHMKLADHHRPIHNLVISNVPGPRFPLYLAGARLDAVYPLGPVMEGAGLNVTVMSYRDSVDVGFMAAAELVGDLWDLADCVEPALEELLAAVAGAAASEVAPAEQASA